MARLLRPALLTLALAQFLNVSARADGQSKNEGQAAKPEQAIRALVAQFDKGDPGWKVRMTSLVGLAKAGPVAVPVLIEALQKGSPSTREFAAQALVLYADSTTQPALERALADPKPGVRLYAIQALSMLGPLPRTKEHERILTNDPTVFGVRPMMAAALERADRPNQAKMRKALAEYDLRNLDSARLGQTAPDFTLTDYTGKTYRLSQFRGKTVVLRFILFDYWWRTIDTFAQLRDKDKEYQRRQVRPVIVMAQQPFQLKHPKVFVKVNEDAWASWSGAGWPDAVPAEVLFDPLSTVSATYGVAFQTQFRDDQNVWSSRPAIFVIDKDGVLRYADSRDEQDIRENEILPILDELEEQRKLITALGTSDGLRREAVRITLAPQGPHSQDAIPELTKALKDESGQVRAGAAVAFYWIALRAGASIPALCEALRDPDRRVRRFSGLALGRLGPEAREAVPALIKVMADEDESVRKAIVFALQGIGPPATAGVTEALRKDQDERIRAAAARALPGLNLADDGHKPVRAALIAALKDDVALVRALAANGLHHLPMPLEETTPAISPLIETLKDKDARVRTAAADALGHIGPHAKAAVPALGQLLEDHVSQVRSRAANALERMGPDAKEAVPGLIQALKDHTADVRFRCVRALARIGPPAKPATAALIELRKDQVEGIRAETAAALGAIGADPGMVTPALVELLKDSSVPVRAAAANALGEIGAKVQAAVAALEQALKDDKNEVHDAAREALKKINPAGANKKER